MKVTLTYGELADIVDAHLASMGLESVGATEFIQANGHVVSVDADNDDRNMLGAELEVKRLNPYNSAPTPWAKRWGGETLLCEQGDVHARS